MSDRKRGRALIDSDSDDSDGSANLDEVNEFFSKTKKMISPSPVHFRVLAARPPNPNKF